MKKRISMTIDADVLESVDKERGTYARSAYLNELLRNTLLGKDE